MTISIDENNTTSTPLAGNATFTGVQTQLVGRTDAFTGISVVINSNTNSSSLGLLIQFSDDSINWITYFQDIYITPLKFRKNYTIIPKKYYRITYTNGSVAQTSFSLISSLTTLTDANVKVDFQQNMIDAFGRLKVSNAFTMIDMRVYKYGIITNPQIIVTKSVGSYTGIVSNSTVNLSGTGVGSYVSQSRKYCVFGGNKGIEIIAVGAMNNGAANTSTCFTRIGYFDNGDGWYYEYNAISGISINVKSSITSTVGIILQSLWNIDKMDGTGPSGINLNFAGRQSFVIQISNIVNFGFQVNGATYYCHSITPLAPVVSVPPVATLNLPIRYEIEGKNSTSSGSMLQGAAVAMAWAGFDYFGKSFTINTDVGGVSLSNNGEIPLLAITGNSNYVHQNIIPKIITTLFTANIDTCLIRVRLYLGGTFPSTGTSTWTDVNSTYSCMKYAIATNITGTGTFITANSINVHSYFINSNIVNTTNLENIFNNFISLTSNVDNVADILVITYQVSAGPIGNQTIYSSIEWQEIY